MNTTVHLYPGINGTLDANNGQNGVVHICDHKKTASHGRSKPSTLAHVDSKELLRELLRRIGEDPDRIATESRANNPFLGRTIQWVGSAR
jgi:hypothetical protein